MFINDVEKNQTRRRLQYTSIAVVQRDVMVIVIFVIGRRRTRLLPFKDIHPCHFFFLPIWVCFLSETLDQRLMFIDEINVACIALLLKSWRTRFVDDDSV